jgi:hypothetical protein
LTLALLLAGALLAVERACYVWIARAPRSFRAWTARPSVAWLGDPVAIVEKLDERAQGASVRGTSSMTRSND